MTPHAKPPRSNYAGKLREFPEFAFADTDAFARRGRWREFFRERVGKRFDDRIIFEIGCADAAFLSRIAAKFPNTAFVGLDWKFKSVYDAAARVASLGLRNVGLVRGRGQDISLVFGENEIDEIWIFHPDPCERDVEWKNRLFSERFLGEAHQALTAGSRICLKTDHREYFEHCLSVLSHQPAQTQFDLTSSSVNFWDDRETQEHTSTRNFAHEVTAFENRFRKKRQPILYIELQKRSVRG